MLNATRWLLFIAPALTSLAHTHPLTHPHTLVSKCRSSCKINIYFYSFSLPFFILLLYLLGLPGRAYKLNALQLATAAISSPSLLPLFPLSLCLLFLPFFSARINSLLHPQKHLMQPCHQLPWQRIQNLNKKQIEVMLATALPSSPPLRYPPLPADSKCQMFNVVKGNQKVETKFRPGTNE